MKETETVIICPYCNKPTEWVDNSEVYGQSIGRSHMIWLCRPCRAYVGCHNNTRIPLGKLANSYLRKLRKNVHGIIDPEWEDGRLKRGTVYEMLSKELGHEVHVGNADEEECKKIIDAAYKIFKSHA